MDTVLTEALHLVLGGVLLAVLVLVVAAIRWAFAKAHAAAFRIRDEIVRSAIEAAILWAEAQMELHGRDKLKVAVAKAQKLLGCSVDEAQVEAILARMKEDGRI